MANKRCKSWSDSEIHTFCFYRFEKLNLTEKGLVVYVGGNVDGSDGRTILEDHCPTW